MSSSDRHYGIYNGVRCDLGPKSPPGSTCCVTGAPAPLLCLGCGKTFSESAWHKHSHTMNLLPPGWTGTAVREGASS